MKIYLWIVLTLLCFSCKKEKATKTHPELVGSWSQLTGDPTADHRVIEISDNSNGTYYYDYPEGDATFRKFRLKDNCLYYGLGNNLGTITQYPEIMPVDMPYGDDDTLRAGSTYIILNNSYWIKTH